VTNRLISVAIMFFWAALWVLGAAMTIPPRRLTSGHVLELALIPLGAFIAYLPGVPLRWFCFYGVMCGAWRVLSLSPYIAGTVSVLGWDGSSRAYLLPAFMFYCVVLASVIAAWLRQLLHRAVNSLVGRHAGDSTQPAA
jgi:hypothetical protein